MTTFLFAQGMEPVALAPDESFNKARGRGNQAITGTNHLGNPDPDAKKKPMNKLTFKTQDEDGNIGRIAINPEKFIGVGSDEEKDAGSSRDDDDEE